MKNISYIFLNNITARLVSAKTPFPFAADEKTMLPPSHSLRDRR